MWTAESAAPYGDVSAVRSSGIQTGSKSVTPESSEVNHGAMAVPKNSRHLDIDERQEARLWESISLSGSGLSLEQLRETQGRAPSVIIEPSLHSITEDEETTSHGAAHKQ